MAPSLTLPDGRQLWSSPEDDVHTDLMALTARETAGIDGIIYSFTLADKISLYIAKRAAGVPVRLILDQSQSGEPGNSTATPNDHAVARLTAFDEIARGGSSEWTEVLRLQGAGWVRGTDYVIGESADGNIIHTKAEILKGLKVATWGSLNWSLSAPNQCNLTSLEVDPLVVAWIQAHFDRNWARLGGV